MAYFRNFDENMESTHDMNEKEGGAGADGTYDSAGIRDTYREKDVDQKTLGLYQSEEDPFDAGRQQSDTSGTNGTEKAGRRTNPAGTWGSSFWKDCQPMWGANEDEYDSKKVEEGSDYESKKAEEGSPDNFSEELDGERDGDQFQKGQAEVPADEMLSDDYYEQDGEEHSDSLHNRGLGQPSTSSSRLPPKATSSNRNISKTLKAAKYNEYEEDEDYEEEEEDEADEDDPDDVDFEPDFGETNRRTRSKVYELYDDLTVI